MTVAPTEDPKHDLRRIREVEARYKAKPLLWRLRNWAACPNPLETAHEAADEIERLRVVFEESCNEVKMSHGTPCFCKYCHEETPK